MWLFFRAAITYPESRRQFEVAVVWLPLGVEDVHQIVRTNGQVERIEVDLAAHLRMHSPKIDDQLVVNEHPHIVIAHEPEHLTDAAVCKLDVDLARKQVVVAAKRSAREDFVEQLAIERVVRRVRVGRDECPRIILQRQVTVQTPVDTWYVGKPLPQLITIGKHHRGAVAGRRLAAGAPIAAKRRVHHSSGCMPLEHIAVHVLVIAIEIAVNDGHDDVRCDSLDARGRRRRGRWWRGGRWRGG